MINSTISTPGTCFCMMDINNFYHGPLILCYEYLKMHILIIPGKSIFYTTYEILCPLIVGFYANCDRLFWLKHVGHIANNPLTNNLAMFRYFPVKVTSCL